jgi:hypothetical protein
LTLKGARYKVEPRISGRKRSKNAEAWIASTRNRLMEVSFSVRPRR